MEENSLPMTSSEPLSSEPLSTFSENNLREIINNVESENENVTLCSKLVKDSVEFLDNLKAIFNSEACTRTQKLQILSLMPETWSASTIAQHFDTNWRMIKVAKEMKKENGILAVSALKKGLYHQCILFVE